MFQGDDIKKYIFWLYRNKRYLYTKKIEMEFKSKENIKICQP